MMPMMIDTEGMNDAHDDADVEEDGDLGEGEGLSLIHI